jgi:hypothetical protein
MKHNHFSNNQTQTPAITTRPIGVADLNRSGNSLAPSRDEIARKAYFSYMNQGSLPGHEEQHWLEAEAQLYKEIAHGAGHHPGS